MKSRLCEMLGIDFPLVAFSHCRDVVAAVSRAGGFGVLGATAFSPEQLDLELKWIDDHNQKLSALALVETPIISSYLSSAKAIMLTIGINFIRLILTAKIIPRIENIIYL